MLSEEEKKAIEELKKLSPSEDAIGIVLNFISRMKKENEKLKDKNQDLLRKLRNRVKEVKKLTKYSLYKKEFSRLNKTIKEKDKQIDLMIEEYEYDARINFKNFCEDELRKDKCIQDCKICAKKYFETKAKGE